MQKIGENCRSDLRLFLILHSAALQQLDNSVLQHTMRVIVENARFAESAKFFERFCPGREKVFNQLERKLSNIRMRMLNDSIDQVGDIKFIKALLRKFDSHVLNVDSIGVQQPDKSA